MQRAKAGRASERLRADANAAELETMDVDNTALHAELGESVKVAAQRQGAGARAAFTFQTIHRDLMTRQCSLNSGAANVRSITKVYSEHIAADGRSLNLESGSLRTVLRWEKRTDVLCMLIEGRALRNAIRTTPETKLWWYMDLSPDCRAIEQYGAGFEYATVQYLRTDAEAPPPFTGELTLTVPATSLCAVLLCSSHTAPTAPTTPTPTPVALPFHRRTFFSSRSTTALTCERTRTLTLLHRGAAERRTIHFERTRPLWPRRLPDHHRDGPPHVHANARGARPQVLVHD